MSYIFGFRSSLTLLVVGSYIGMGRCSWCKNRIVAFARHIFVFSGGTSRKPRCNLLDQCPYGRGPARYSLGAFVPGMGLALRLQFNR